jgi:hypothetical protein
LKNCLGVIINSSQFEDYEFVALVHKKSLFDEDSYAKLKSLNFSEEEIMEQWVFLFDELTIN